MLTPKKKIQKKYTQYRRLQNVLCLQCRPGNDDAGHESHHDRGCRRLLEGQGGSVRFHPFLPPRQLRTLTEF